MRQGLLPTLARYSRQQHWQAAASHNLAARQFCSTLSEEVLREIEQNKKDREEGYREAMEAQKRREGSPLPYPSLRLDAYRGIDMQLPHYPDAYLESKHCKVFAHWRAPKGVRNILDWHSLSQRCISFVAEWTGFLAAQLFNAGAAAVAHVPAWLPGVNIPRETVWLRRLLILESIAPVPGSAAASAAYVKVLWSLQQDARYIQAFQQESDNARAHLTALLSASPSTMQKLFVLLSQAAVTPPYMLAFTLAPRACHAFMTALSGLTGEALTDALLDMDARRMPDWAARSLPAPVLEYWGLPPGTPMRTVLLAMRADVNARMVINQGADFRTVSLNGELSSLEEYFHEEDPLDYTAAIEDVELPGDLYADRKNGASSTAANSQFRRFSTGRGLHAIRERHPSGLRRFWGTASGSSTPRRAPSVSSMASSEAEAAQGQAWRFGGRKHAASSKKLPSVSSVASSEQDPAQDQGWPFGARKEAARTREAVSRRSSVSSDLDSAQGIARGGPKGFRGDSLHVEVPGGTRLRTDKYGSPEKSGADLMSVMDKLWARGS